MKYKCGHKPETIIMNTTLLSLAVYTSWLDDNEGLCFDCYCDKEKEGIVKP